MRTIKQLPIPQNSDSKFPQSTILNETETEEGTPVVEEIYGDILTNHYKLLQEVGIAPTGTQDNDDTQYQILEALKKLPNSLNDIEQILTLTGTVWGIPLNIDYLPNKYFLVARASENYVEGTAYTFKGSSATVLGFTSDGFKGGDELLVIIDSSNVRAYSLSALNQSPDDVFTVMGNPISFNDTNKMWYEENGNLISDVPSTNYLEGVIRVDVSDGTILVNDIFVLNGFVLCFCVVPATNVYFFRQFDLNDFSASDAVTLSGTSFASVSDFSPYVYAKQGFVYVTNAMNTTVNDYSITKLNYNSVTATLTFVSTISLDVSFVKTSNAVVKSDLLYTMISGFLYSYNLISGTKVSLGIYSGVIGQLFGFNGEVYFSSGEVAKKWF
jgi:hypothetical protein